MLQSLPTSHGHLPSTTAQTKEVWLSNQGLALELLNALIRYRATEAPVCLVLDDPDAIAQIDWINGVLSGYVLGARLSTNSQVYSNGVR